MSSPESPAAEPPDRRTGLVLFGILDVLIAFVYLVKTLALVLIAFAGAKPHLAGVDVASELPVAALLTLAPAGFFLSVGIGSCVGRRWARSLSIAFSWIWLGFGSVTAIALLLCLPGLAAAGGDKPPLAAYGLLLLFGIGLPGAYLLFYRSKAVKAYCEWLDSEERWTDRCPVPILTVMLILAIGAELALGIGFSASRQILFFGHALDWNVRIWIAAAGAFEILVAWSLLRKKLWAWIAAVAIMVARGAASIAIARTFSIDRLTRLATEVSSNGLKKTDTEALALLKALDPSTAITTYVAVLALLELGFVIWAGKWVRRGASPSPGDH